MRFFRFRPPSFPAPLAMLVIASLFGAIGLWLGVHQELSGHETVLLPGSCIRIGVPYVPGVHQESWLGSLHHLESNGWCFYVFLLSWLRLGWHQAWQLRLPCLFAGMLCLPVLYSLGRRLQGQRWGVCAAFLFAANALTLAAAAHLRFYAFAMLFELLFVYSLHRAWEQDILRVAERPRSWRYVAWAALWGSLALSSMNLSGILMLVVMVAYLAASDRQRRHWLTGALLGSWFGLCALVLYLRDSQALNRVMYAILPWWEQGARSLFTCGFERSHVPNPLHEQFLQTYSGEERLATIMWAMLATCAWGVLTAVYRRWRRAAKGASVGATQASAFGATQVPASGAIQASASGAIQVPASDATQVPASGATQASASGATQVPASGATQVTALFGAEMAQPEARLSLALDRLRLGLVCAPWIAAALLLLFSQVVRNVWNVPNLYFVVPLASLSLGFGLAEMPKLGRYAVVLCMLWSSPLWSLATYIDSYGEGQAWRALQTWRRPTDYVLIYDATGNWLRAKRDLANPPVVLAPSAATESSLSLVLQTTDISAVKPGQTTFVADCVLSKLLALSWRSPQLKGHRLWVLDKATERVCHPKLEDVIPAYFGDWRHDIFCRQFGRERLWLIAERRSPEVPLNVWPPTPLRTKAWRSQG